MPAGLDAGLQKGGGGEGSGAWLRCQRLWKVLARINERKNIAVSTRVQALFIAAYQQAFQVGMDNLDIILLGTWRWAQAPTVARVCKFPISLSVNSSSRGDVICAWLIRGTNPSLPMTCRDWCRRRVEVRCLYGTSPHWSSPLNPNGILARVYFLFPLVVFIAVSLVLQGKLGRWLVDN